MSTYSLSGNILGIGGHNAKVTLLTIEGEIAVTTSDSSGNYAFSGLSNGVYAVVPSNPGYLSVGRNSTFLKPNHTFIPDVQYIQIGGSDAVGVNFTATYTRPGSTPYILSNYGCTGFNPSYIATSQDTFQLFEQPSFIPNVNPGTVTPPPWSTPGNNYNFGNQARYQMPGQVISVPPTGSLNGRIMKYVIEGTIVVPASAVNAGFELTVNQNYVDFGEPIVSDALFQMRPPPLPPVSLAAGSTTNFFLIGTLAGSGIGTSVLASAGILSVNGSVSYGGGFSNRLINREPVLLLSCGVTFSGGSGSGLFQAYLNKFQIIQTPL